MQHLMRAGGDVTQGNRYDTNTATDAERAEILSTMERLAVPGSSHLMLLNFYKDIPVSYPAAVLMVDEDRVMVETHPLQARVIELAKDTVIRGEFFQREVKVAAECLNVSHGAVVLSDFRYLEPLSYQRNSVRVRLQHPIRVTLEAGQEKFGGSLKNISLGGCAVDIMSREPLGTYKYLYLNLDLPAAPGSPPLKARVKGQIVRVEGDARPFRCAFSFDHDAHSEFQIGSFISQRQQEIIRELKTAIGE